MLGDIAPIDVFVLDAGTNNVRELEIDAASAIPASENIALGVHFLAHNFADKIQLLIRCYSFSDVSKKAGVGRLPGFEVNVGERGAAGPVKKEPVPGKANFPASKPIPNRLYIPHRTKFCLGRNALVYGFGKKIVLLELVRLCGRGGSVSNKAAFGAEDDVAKLQVESGLHAPDRLSVGIVMPGYLKGGKHAAFTLASETGKLVKLLLQVHVRHLVTEMKMVERRAVIDADIKPGPIARIDW